jgi:ankyrin repeat protein
VKALSGWTPLHAAVWYGRESTSKALMEYGANMESRSQDGEIPLFVAARHGARGSREAAGQWSALGRQAQARPLRLGPRLAS